MQGDSQCACDLGLRLADLATSPDRNPAFCGIIGRELRTLGLLWRYLLGSRSLPSRSVSAAGRKVIKADAELR